MSMISLNFAVDLPYPFNIRSTDLVKGNQGRIFFEKYLHIREFKYIPRQSYSINKKSGELAKWIKKMEKENPDYELEDSQLIFRPKYPPLQKYAIIGAKICLKKKEWWQNDRKGKNLHD